MANFQFNLLALNIALWESQKMLDISGQKFLTKAEGIQYTAYLDSVNVWTIGRGITYYEDGTKVKKGDRITVDREEKLFLNTLKKYVAVVNTKVTSNINQNQFNALVSFCYNVGIGGFTSSTLLKKVNKNPNDPTIRNEFAKWNKGTINGKKQIINGLVNRRKAEADLYFKK
ncbi:lysozyme [Chryseobacterium sp.]|uniref:lysozyme n=1 Tax=Chryseobacterium sp. TaxID=1871047 RepID=UPI0028984B92|nr:lysozyme [Chryseobacterium sp.]